MKKANEFRAWRLILVAVVWAGSMSATAQNATQPPTPEAAGAEGEAKPAIKIDLSSPRAAMQSFLVAIQDAGGDRPERIDDAVSCLDGSELAEDGRQERARSLVRQRLADRW